MEKLIIVVMLACLGGLAVCLSGLWLLHTAVNSGNVWMGIVGAIAAGTGGLLFVVTVPAFRP